MLDELHIRALGVIEDATLRLAPGLTVVTGETGAGKTMIVGALELLLGARADTSQVRSGEDTALVEARISPVPPSAADWVADGDGELIVSREVQTEGRSRVRLGGRLAPVGALADALGGAVEVHAQHAHVRLGRPEVQRDLLDRYGGEEHGALLAAYRDAYQQWHEARARLESLEAEDRERAREHDRLRREVEEIDAAELDPDTDDHLDIELDQLEHVEELQRAAAAAEEALGDDGAREPLAGAARTLRAPHVEAPDLDELRGRLDGLLAEADELARDLRGYREGLDTDPERLESLRARRRLVTELCRKYGEDTAAVLAYATRARERLEELEHTEHDVARLRDTVDEQQARARELAGRLTASRRAAGERLAATVAGHLRDLAMPEGGFEVRVEPRSTDELGPAGADRVGFLLAPNPGEPARPLGEAASGGERSRAALAIEVALADVSDARVLVFDEVDAGIGGATALAVGAKLAALADAGRQVLCVTHLAQLAAFADVHHVVDKQVTDGRTVTLARRVGDDERAGELSRMLSGAADSLAAQRHADELLQQARELRGAA